MPTRRMSVTSSFPCSVNLYQSVSSLTSSLSDYKYSTLPRRPPTKYRPRTSNYLTTGYSTYSSLVSRRDAFLSDVLRTPIKTTRYTPDVFRPVVRDIPTFTNYSRPPTSGHRLPDSRGISRYRQLIILRDKKTNRGDSTRSNDSGIDITTSSRESECSEHADRKSCKDTEQEVDNAQETECKSNCHRKCEQHMPNLCGVNEKLLSEVLSTVKKDITVTSPVSKDTHSKAGECRGRPLTPGSSDSDDNCDHLLERLNSPLGAGPEKEDKTSLRLKYRKYMVDDFNFLKVLGRGSYGKVMLAESKDHSHYFAIKCLKKDVVLEGNDVECTKIEKRVMALGTTHPYICRLYCTFQTQSHLFFVMEYLCGGDLMFHIQQSGRFDQERARFYASEIVSALKFLHKKGIVYRDAKLDNIVLDSEGHIRLVDFGFCKFRIYRKECLPKNLCGTPDYMAPEIIRGQRYNQSVDWWSFGVLLYEMLVGQSPFTGSDEEELFWSICNEEAYYPRFLSKEAKQLLVLLLDKTPETRLGMPDCTAGDVCSQPFFRTINWEKVERKEVHPPFKPNLRGPNDVSNFDTDFTTEKAVLTPIAPEILASMDQTQFKGFTYTNPHITE